MEIILWDKGAENGPHDLSRVQNLIRQGRISPKVLARLSTGTEWRPLESLLPTIEKKPAQVTPLPENKSNTIKAKVVRLAILAAVILSSVSALVAVSRWREAENEKQAEREALAAVIESSREALNILRKLEAVTASGVNFPEYSRRLLDTKMAFVLAMRPAHQDTEETQAANEAMRAAMDDFVAAKDFWAHCIKGGPGLVHFSAAEQQPFLHYGLGFPEGNAAEARDVSLIWAHASRNIREAQQALDSVKSDK